MPEYVVERIGALLNEKGEPLRESRILVLGVAYKRDVADTRESPAIDIMTLLAKRGSIVSYHDPYVSSVTHAGACWTSVDLSAEALRNADCVVIAADHARFDMKSIVESATLIFDTRNATRVVPGEHPNVSLL